MKPLLASALLLLSALPAAAQGLGEPRMGPPAFLRRLFLPALVMEHQQEIELTTAQREAITREMNATQQKVVELRWTLEQKSEALDKLLAAEKVDEHEVMARAAEVLDVERQMKQAHLTLLVRIKNQLNAKQQEKLAALRPRGGRFGFRRGMRGGEGPPPED